MLEGLDDQASDWFERESIGEERRVIVRTSDLRYAGQNYELQVPFPSGPLDANAISLLERNFEAAHLRRFGFESPGDPVELVTIRLEAVGTVSKADLFKANSVKCSDAPSPAGSRVVWMPEFSGRGRCPVFDRSDLRFGHVLEGPAIVEQMDTTTLVLPGMRAAVDKFLNLILDTGR